MKIFNRGSEPKPAPAPAPAGPAAAIATAAPEPAPAPAPAAPPAPDLTAILDANVKEMSEKLAKLTNSIESAQAERSGFETKIEAMEERMRKLSSLTEMISAQYNPFVGDAPTEREALPSPEIGLAQPLPPMAAPEPIAAPSPGLNFGLDAPLDMPIAAPDFDPTFPAEAAAPEAAMPAAASPIEDHAEVGDAHVWAVKPSFEASMILLEWADMLLRSAGSREAVVSLANYYHNIGWIGDPARDQLLAYADGIAAPETDVDRDWRVETDVHERSLLYVEKLRAAARRRA